MHALRPAQARPASAHHVSYPWASAFRDRRVGNYCICSHSFAARRLLPSSSRTVVWPAWLLVDFPSLPACVPACLNLYIAKLSPVTSRLGGRGMNEDFRVNPMGSSIRLP